MATKIQFAYSYGRCSTGKQLKGDTFRRQDEMAREWCAKYGVPLDDPATGGLNLRDRGLSGYSGANRKRGALGRFLGLVEGGQIPTGRGLLIENVDRLSREPVLGALNTFTRLIERGIVIVLLDLDWTLDTDTLNRETWRLQAVIQMMERAHQESLRKSQVLRAQKAAKRERIVRGGVEGHTCPGWLRFDHAEKRYVLAEKSPAISRMFDLVAQHLSTYRACQVLAAEGFTGIQGRQPSQLHFKDHSE